MNELSRGWSISYCRMQVEELNQSFSRSIPGTTTLNSQDQFGAKPFRNFADGVLAALPVALGAALGLDLLLVGIYFTSGWAQQQAVTRPG